jgi:hypothetical protein
MISVQRGLLLLILAAPAWTQAVVPWTFRSDFQHGLTGWMSYPLPQDLGFDPTLSVEKSATGWELIREVVSVGQKRMKIGVVRPIGFIARAETRITILYRTTFPQLRLTLAGKDGRRFEARIAGGKGSREVRIAGNQLGLTNDVAVEAIVIEGAIDAPSATAPNRIVIEHFEIASFRTRELSVSAPQLVDYNGDGEERVAARPLLLGEPLVVRFAATSPVTLKLYDPDGKPVEQRIESSQPISLRPNAAGLWTAELSGAEGTSRFSLLVMANANPHPRTLYTAARLRELKNGSEFAAIRKQIHDQAHGPAAPIKTNAAAGVNILKLPSGKSLRAEYDGELTAYFQLLDSYSNAIAWCALDYALNGDANSLASSKQNLLAVAQWPTWTPPRFASHGLHTYYEVGLFAQKLALAYDLIASDLTQKEKVQIADAFWKNVITPTVDEYFRFDRMPLAASNWMANSLGGALMAAVVTQGDIDGWRDREGTAVSQLAAAYVRNLRALFPGDASEMEPVGYQHFAMQGFSWGAAALDSLQIQPRELRQMFSAVWWPKYAMVRPNLLLDTGDFNGELRTFDGFAYAAQNSGLAWLRSFYDERPKRDASLLDLVCCTGKAQAKQGSTPPLSRIFPDRGSAVLRSDWTPDATVISLRAGPWFNHEHHDQGSFQVAAFGDRIISEAGYANYYRDPNYPTYFTQAPGHNTVLIDDDPFSQSDSSGAFWPALNGHLSRLTAHLLSPHFDYIEAELSGAYNQQLSTYTRKFLFIRPDVLILTDEVQSPQPHRFSWLLHPAEGTTPHVSGNRVRIETSAAIADVLAAVGAPEWKMDTTPLPISIFQDLNRGVIHDRYVLALKSLPTHRAEFVTGIQFRARGASPPSMTTLKTPGAIGFEDAQSGWKALFRSGPAPLRCQDFSTDGRMFVTRVTDWSVAGATNVTRGTDLLLKSSSAVDVAYTEVGKDLQFDLFVPASATIDIHVPPAATSAIVDEVPIKLKPEHLIQSLEKGEHRVRILAGNSL